MDPGNAARPPAAPPGGFSNLAGAGRGAANGRGGNRRLTNMEQHLLAEDNAAAGAAGFYGARAAVNMYGGLQGAGLRGVPGLMPGQFDESGLAGLQGAAGLGGLNAIGQNLQAQQQQAAAQQRAMAAQQQAAAAGAGGVDFQGLMPTGFDGTDASAALLGNPAAMAGYPFAQAGFNAAALGVDGAPGGNAGLLNANAAAMGNAANMAAARNAQFGNAQFGNAPAVGSLFDQGYNFARSEMALVRHQAALNNNAALMGAAAGGGQAGFNLAGLDRQGAAAGLRGMGGVNPYGNYGGDPLMGAAGGPTDPYLGRGGPDGNPAAGAHLTTIPAIRLAQHRNTLQRRMMVNNLPERKDGSFPVVLYQESDEHKLTAYQCLLRKQLELFEADEDDVRCSTRQGRTAPIKLGQVGLRCRHCAGVQLAARTKGAAYYSQTVEGIYQIAQNMSKVHLCERCYRIPRDVRRQLIVLRSDCRRAIGGKEYWSENIRALGVYVDEGILRVKKAPKEESKDDDEKKDGDDEKKEGETKEVVKDEEMKEGETKEVVKDEEMKDGETKEVVKDEEMKEEDEEMKEGESADAAGDVQKEDEGDKKEESSEETKTPEVKEEEAAPTEEEKAEEKETPAEKEDEASKEEVEGETPKEEETTKTEGEKETPIEEGESATDAKEENGEDKTEEEGAKKEDDAMDEDKKDEATPEEDKKEEEDEKEEEEKTGVEEKPEETTKEDKPDDGDAMEVDTDDKKDDDAKEDEAKEEEKSPAEAKEEEEKKGPDEKGEEGEKNGENAKTEVGGEETLEI